MSLLQTTRPQGHHPRRFSSPVGGNFLPTVYPAVLFIICCLFITGGCSRSDINQAKAETFKLLSAKRAQKKSALVTYVTRVHQQAESALNDPTLLDFFETNRHSQRPDNDTRLDPSSELAIDKHFVLHYPAFYDLLFIDSSGYVFHSIRQEADYHTNLFSGDQKQSRLAVHLQAGSPTTIVDFEQYDPSQEPASFHVIPVGRRGRCTGWLVFQHSINGINAILTDRSGLGRTGEIYLVGRDGLLLTDSRFTRDNAILRERLRKPLIADLDQNNTSNAVTLDYRQVRVFSSRERFDLLGLPWTILAEIDEDEVITNYYVKHVEGLQDAVIYNAAKAVRVTAMPPVVGKPSIRVDMNEYAVARNEETINTWGVSSCTAVVMCYPGRFAYLAHIGPGDRAYTKDRADRTDNGLATDILTNLLGRVKHFELYPSQVRDLKITIIATHDEAIGGIFGKLIAEGIDLAQISLALNFSADAANVTASPTDSSLVIEWVKSSESFFEDASNLENLSSMVKTITGYSEGTVTQPSAVELSARDL